LPWGELYPHGAIAVSEVWSEVFELCYIPMLGGGFGMSLEDAKRMSSSERRKALTWLESRRKKEQDSLKNTKGGSQGQLTKEQMERLRKMSQGQVTRPQPPGPSKNSSKPKGR
jgi:hypothetical protein